jgi:hypothetical protein
MIHLSDHVLASYPQRARGELSAAWEHLLTAAHEGARQVGDTSRTRAALVRDRASLARLALRGELPTSRWRWAGAGLAAGVIIGAVVAVVVTRRPRTADPTTPEQAQTAATAVREKAGAAAAAAREKTSTAVQTAATAVHDAAAAARDIAGRVREKAAGHDAAADSESPPQPPSRPSTGRED